MTPKLVLSFLVLMSTSAAAQRVDVAITRQPSRGGSFAATLVGGTSGALVGLFASVAISTAGASSCVTGGGCDDTGGPDFLFVAGSTVAGSAGGALLGRRLSGGRQSPLGSFLGATVGLLAGAWLSTQLRPDGLVPGALTLTIPTGLFATLGGW